MDSNLIIIEQLPIIKEKLSEVKSNIEIKTQEVMSLACTNETIQVVKKKRAELNKEFKDWEEKRKEVKKAIISPYEEFEKAYKECISDIYKQADKALSNKINDTEQVVKDEKEAEAREYFEELKTSENIDFICFENIGLNITLSVSKKKLKELVTGFVGKIKEDIALIQTMSNKEELFVEYKKHLDITKAIATVTERQRLIEEEKNKIAEQSKIQEQQQVVTVEEKPIKPLEKPVEIETEYVLKFKVIATKSKLIKLKEFLDKGEYKYEQQ